MKKGLSARSVAFTLPEVVNKTEHVVIEEIRNFELYTGRFYKIQSYPNPICQIYAGDDLKVSCYVNSSKTENFNHQKLNQRLLWTLLKEGKDTFIIKSRFYLQKILSYHSSSDSFVLIRDTKPYKNVSIFECEWYTIKNYHPVCIISTLSGKTISVGLKNPENDFIDIVPENNFFPDNKFEFYSNELFYIEKQKYELIPSYKVETQNYFDVAEAYIINRSFAKIRVKFEGEIQIKTTSISTETSKQQWEVGVKIEAQFKFVGIEIEYKHTDTSTNTSTNSSIYSFIHQYDHEITVGPMRQVRMSSRIIVSNDTSVPVRLPMRILRREHILYFDTDSGTYYALEEFTPTYAVNEILVRRNIKKYFNIERDADDFIVIKIDSYIHNVEYIGKEVHTECFVLKDLIFQQTCILRNNSMQLLNFNSSKL